MTIHRRVLVDTDAGVDDILALFVLMQIAPPSTIDVAVTFGNVTLDQALSNVALFSFVSGLSPHKVFRGSSAPILGKPRFATDVHGPDGLGGITNLPLWRPPPTGPSPMLFRRTKFDYEKIVALGPMTDIARLTQLSSSAPPLFVMGGAFDVSGNVSSFAEFNFYSDAHAAGYVFEHYAGEIFVVPLDVCNTVILGRQYFGDLCDKNRSSAATFLKLIHQHYMDFYRKLEGIDGCHPYDALTICASVEQDLFEWNRGLIRICKDDRERGRSLFKADSAGRHYVARRVDTSRFFKILESAVGNFKEVCGPDIAAVK